MQLVLDIYHPSLPAVMLKAKQHLVITPPVSRCRDGTAQCWWSMVQLLSDAASHVMGHQMLPRVYTPDSLTTPH